ncbi:MAG: DNA primase, partial [Clostridia bacterium]
VMQKGRSYWAACPFHHEKTPSFSISRNGQFYKCFGCGVSGDVIKFVMEFESVSFIEAVTILSKRVGMVVPLSEHTQLDEKKIVDDKAHYSILKEILKQTAKFYRNVLVSENGKEGLDYLHNRGFSDKTIKTFGLGISPDFDSLQSYLTNIGYGLPDAKEAGVLDVNKNGKYYDSLFKRLIIPIINSMGEVVAFGGRTLVTKPDFAKYKNTSETPIFSKSKNIYNINTIKKIKQASILKYVIITEGYMDVISLFNVGINNVVASMGTSLTIEQAKLLHRYVNDVYICYDGDYAGKAATIRGLDILKGEGLTVKVMSMPDGLDPDEVIKNYGVERFNNLVQNAQPLIDYKLTQIAKEFDLNDVNPNKRNENRLNFTREAVKILSSITDAVERRTYINKISYLSGFTDDFLESAASSNIKIDFVPPQIKLNKYEKAVSYIAACMLTKKFYVDWTFYPTCEKGSTAYKIFEYIKQSRQNGETPKMSKLFSIIGEADNMIEAIINVEFSDKPFEKDYYRDCVNMLKRDEIDTQITTMKNTLNSANASMQLEIMAEIAKLVKQRNLLS